MMVLSTPLVNKRPSNLLTGYTTPPPPSLWVTGGIGLLGDHIQELHNVYLTRFRTYKNALSPQGVFKQINTCRQVTLLVNF
jgi:hypothetical protein